MDPWSAAIGGTTALASSIIGAIGSANANRKANNLISTQRKENKAWYDLKRAEDYTQRSDVQAILGKQRELLDEQYKRARATNIVAGGTDEALALQQKAANDSMADTMATVAGQASAYKDAAEAQYRQQDAALNQQQVAGYQQQAQAMAQAAGQGVSAGLNIMGSGIIKKNV